MKTRIKQLRQEKNYTQEFLAVKVGANQTALSRIECGLSIPDADLIVRLSAAFHVSAAYPTNACQKTIPQSGMPMPAADIRPSFHCSKG